MYKVLWIFEILLDVKLFYRSVKIPDQVGDDWTVIAGLTGNLIKIPAPHYHRSFHIRR